MFPLDLTTRDLLGLHHYTTILEVFVVTLGMDRVKIFMDASVNLNVSCSLRPERESAKERGPALISRC